MDECEDEEDDQTMTGNNSNYLIVKWKCFVSLNVNEIDIVLLINCTRSHEDFIIFRSYKSACDLGSFKVFCAKLYLELPGVYGSYKLV
jgi:hypothetical protein